MLRAKDIMAEKRNLVAVPIDFGSTAKERKYTILDN